MSVFFSSPCVSPRSLSVALLAFWILHSLTWETIFSGCLLGEAARYHEAWLVGGAEPAEIDASRAWGQVCGGTSELWGPCPTSESAKFRICTGQERAGKEHVSTSPVHHSDTVLMRSATSIISAAYHALGAFGLLSTLDLELQTLI